MGGHDAHDWGVSEGAAALQRSALVWDAHGGWAFSKAGVLSQLARWRAAGADFLSINVAYDAAPPWTRAIEALAQYRHWLRTHDDESVLVGTAAEVRQAQRAPKLAVAFDVEGMDALNGDVGMVEVYYQLGVRQMLFAYNRSNLAGCGCHDDEGAPDSFGQRVIVE